MSNEKIELMTAVSSVIDFIKEQVSSDLMRAKQVGMISQETDDLKRIARVVEQSITSSYTKSAGQIELAVQKAST